MAKYLIEAGYVTGGHYKGSVVDEADFADGEVDRLTKMTGSIRKLTDEEAAALDVPESDLSDGDGIALNSQGINIAPDAPPQPGDASQDAVSATTVEPFDGNAGNDQNAGKGKK